MSPFKNLTAKTGKPFWITGKFWNALVEACNKDRIYFAAGTNFIETPTTDGRAISLLGQSGGGGDTVTSFYILNGVLVTYEVVVTDGPTTMV